MFKLIIVLIFIICILLVLIVLVQNSKGGGLASNFQSSGQIMGVRKTTDFLEKATWGLAAALLFLSITATAFIPRTQAGVDESRVQQKIDNIVDPMQEPSFPTTAPAPAQSTPAPANEGGSN
ncbi:MAG: preprotein translocase subunit SecG [Draconibacterium sp.]|nr:MAG: preprotein translocase subunit SecG [Draconibacterium sp.]